MAYRINGRDAEGDAYLAAIDSLPDNELKYVDIGFRNNRLRISTWEGGLKLLDFRPDGSSRAARKVMSKDEVKILVASFLTNHDGWKVRLDWEQIEISSREAWYRTARLLLIAVTVIVITLLALKFIRH